MSQLTVGAVAIEESPADAERDAFEAIYRAHSAAVFNYAARLCGATLAADVTQDVFLRVWSGRPLFDPARGSMHSLLLTMTHSRAVDVLRSGAARVRREDRVGPSAAFDEIDTVLLRNERSVEIAAALARLRTEARDPIVMAVYGQMSYREVAVALDLPEGTVKSRIRSGLRQLHRLLAAPVSDDGPATTAQLVQVPCPGSFRTT